MSFLNILTQYDKEGKIPAKYTSILKEFFQYYSQAIAKNDVPLHEVEPRLEKFLHLIADQTSDPFKFDCFHKSIRSPFDYYSFGKEFIRPLIDINNCKIHGLDNVKNITAQLANNENVILLANHQSEMDPQIIGLLLEKSYQAFASQIIFVAGHRVTTDPLAVPLSKGVNMLCIWSKKHIDNPPELKEQKQLQNQRTLKQLGMLLSDGGKCLYVAPSGGRDRPNSEGILEVAPFDPQSVEMFSLIAQQTGRPTHFYPLALATYDLQPPPPVVEQELGERRLVYFTPVHIAFGKEIDMNTFPGSNSPDKKLRRQHRAEYIHSLVKDEYQKLIEV